MAKTNEENVAMNGSTCHIIINNIIQIDRRYYFFKIAMCVVVDVWFVLVYAIFQNNRNLKLLGLYYLRSSDLYRRILVSLNP